MSEFVFETNVKYQSIRGEFYHIIKITGGQMS